MAGSSCIVLVEGEYLYSSCRTSYYCSYRMLSYVLNIFHCMKKTKNYPDVSMYANDCACRGKAPQKAKRASILSFAVFSLFGAGMQELNESKNKVTVKTSFPERTIYDKWKYFFLLAWMVRIFLCISSDKNIKKEFSFWIFFLKVCFPFVSVFSVLFFVKEDVFSCLQKTILFSMQCFRQGYDCLPGGCIALFFISLTYPSLLSCLFPCDR